MNVGRLILHGLLCFPASMYSNDVDARSLQDEQQCLALALYWEARGESRQGMVAVGWTILNRTDSEHFPATPCAVVYQGSERSPCQFSWWCDGKSDRPTHEELWASSLNLADELLTARPSDPTHGALFFHNTSIQTPWRRKKTTRIGNHIFYR